MRRMLAPLFALALSVMIPSAPKAEEGPTPYGAPCPLCRNYGQCGQMLSIEDSNAQLNEFYAEKGLTVRNINPIRPGPMAAKPAGVFAPRPGMGEGMDRFLGADVFDGERLVDKVIFDRKTGRMRSIY